MATATAALSMKLLVDTKARRVLFAEASKDVVDFLFSLLSLPVGTAVQLLGKEAMVGSVGRLYASVEKLDATYVQAGSAKDALLHPTVFSAAVSNQQSSLLGLPPPPQPKSFYICTKRCSCYNGGHSSCRGISINCLNSCRAHITCAYGTTCPSCKNQMTTQLTLVPPAESGGQAASVVAGNGFVQGIVTYTVMDDLAVTPMSSISSIALLNTFAVNDLGALQPPGEDRADRLQRGFGDSQGVAAVQDRPHRRLPWQEGRQERLKASFCDQGLVVARSIQLN
uniref:Uncharacterized protein n=1 Tax=Avena sativa TaxID=4498 RepID=A0ACD5TRF0_AVESA